MKKSKIIPILVMAFGLGCFSYCSKPSTETTRIETASMQFMKGSVDEELFNLIKNILPKEDIEYYERVKKFEEPNYRFRPRKKYKVDEGVYTLEGIFSVLQTYNTLATNLSMISHRDKLNHEKLDNLLSKTDEISANTQDELEKIIKIYDFLSKHFRTNLTDRSLNILELLEEDGKGDCGDLAPAYCAIFKHYGIDCDLEFGFVEFGDGSGGMHAWLRFYVGEYDLGPTAYKGEKHRFELDPTFYRLFTPLKPRLDR